MEVGKGYSRMQNYTCDMELVLYTNCLCNWAITLLLLSTPSVSGRIQVMTPNPKSVLTVRKFLSYISRQPETR